MVEVVVVPNLGEREIRVRVREIRGLDREN